MERTDILLIDEAHGATVPPLFSSDITRAGYAFTQVEPEAALGYLQEAQRTGRAPAVLVLGPGIDSPIAVVRELRAAWPGGPIVFVRQPNDVDRLRRELGRSFMIGTERTVAQVDDPQLTAIVLDAARSFQRRRKLRTTLDRANMQIASQKAVDSLEYRRLLISQHYLASFLSQAQDAIVGFDIELRILYWNPSAERLFNISAKEVINLPAEQLPFWTPPVERAVRRLRNGEQAVMEQVPCSLRDKDVILEIAFSSVRNDESTTIGISMFIRDVTARHREAEAERALLEQLVTKRTSELRKTELALYQAQKLEAIGKLTGGVAHDFNNILQVIRSNLELLSMTLPGKESELKRIHSAVAAVERGTKLSSHLLSFARRQPLKPTSINLGRVLRELDDLLRRALGEAIEIETVIGGGLWNTLVDRNQIENVILNLAINARDAMDGAGKLTLEVGNAMLDEHYARQHEDVAPGQYVMLAVSDTGCGMTADVLERAFEPFFTTKGEGEGTGLGLSMAYGFVKQSGGHIKLYSEPGQGTTIRIYLPRSYQQEEYAGEAPRLSISGGDEAVLIVEDDPSVQAVGVDMLTGLGYKVMKASDAQSALAILRSGVKVDLLFTDVVMPGPLRGPDLAKHAKELMPDISVLFTSGYTQNAIVHGGRLEPGVELLSKPYSREALARKIRHLLERNRLGR